MCILFVFLVPGDILVAGLVTSPFKSMCVSVSFQIISPNTVLDPVTFILH